METKKKKPDWIFSKVVDTEDGKGRWTKVGVAFDNRDSITVLSDIYGKHVLTKPLDLDIDKVVSPDAEERRGKPQNPNYPFDGY